MKVLGLDPSSSLCGVALLQERELLRTWTWEKTKSKSDAWNLNDYYEWLTKTIQNPFGGVISPMACVEFLKVTRNAETTRKVSHYQAASVLACKQQGLVVIEASVSQARKEALGNGGLSKEDAFAMVKKLFPDHKFKRADKGGMDESDAIVLGIAGPGMAEK
jgi:Holliday junction resolvasome RuvABC endonuclease subunit